MDEPRTLLPRTLTLIEQGMADKTHIGAQVYVSIDGRPLADFGVGEARPGVPMDADSMMIWFSSTKPVAAVAIAQLWERGLLELDDRVAQHIPEFGVGGKEPITLRHVLTHTGGFRFVDRNPDGSGVSTGFTASWEELIQRICAAPLDEGWIPGQKAGYHPGAGWMILGEIVRRLDGRTYDRYVREAIFGPLGMTDSWVGMPPERHAAYGNRIGVMHNTEREPRPMPLLDAAAACARSAPGGGGRGPIRELGRFHEMLLFRGQANGARIISPQSVEALTARHRVGMYDETFQQMIDWGLGFIINQAGYGRHSSPRAFGHAGAQSSQGFVDPEQRLVVACVCNGMPGEVRNYRRFRALSTAIHEDLGLAEAGSPGRNTAKAKAARA